MNVVVELGTQHGGTYWAWCQIAADTASIVSIDLPGNDERRSRLRSYPRRTQSQTLIEGDSHDPRTVRMVDGLRGSVDLLFIDGDHSYEGVRSDFENYAHLVKPGGVIAFHDIAPSSVPSCQVDRLWRQLLDLYVTREIVFQERDGQAVFGIGVIFWQGNEDLAKWPSTHGRRKDSLVSVTDAESPRAGGAVAHPDPDADHDLEVR